MRSSIVKYGSSDRKVSVDVRRFHTIGPTIGIGLVLQLFCFLEFTRHDDAVQHGERLGERLHLFQLFEQFA